METSVIIILVFGFIILYVLLNKQSQSQGQVTAQPNIVYVGDRSGLGFRNWNGYYPRARYGMPLRRMRYY